MKGVQIGMGCKFKNILLTSILAVAGIFGVSSGIVGNQAANKPFVKSTAATEVTYSTPAIQIHVVDKMNFANGGKMDLRIYSISYDSNFAFANNLSGANAAGVFSTWDGMWYIDSGAIDFNGTGERYDDNGTWYNSYKFYIPWWITGFTCKIHQNDKWVNDNAVYSVSSRQYDRRFLCNDGGADYITGQVTAAYNYNSDAYRMTFETDGGTDIANYDFRVWEKASKPADPVKFGYTFDDWYATDDPSDSTKATFGTYLTSDVTVYARYTGGFNFGIILWLPNRDPWFHDFTYVHYWGDGFIGTTWPGVSQTGTIEINKETYHYLLPTLGKPTGFVIHNNSGSQTSDILIGDAQLEGTQYYNLRDSTSDGGQYGSGWLDLNISITNYYDQGGTAMTGTPSSTLPTQFAFGSDIEALPTLSKDGYKFEGWYKDSACTGSQVTTIGGFNHKEDFNLYAKWTNGEAAAIAFATAFNDDIGSICNDYDANTKSSFVSNWNGSEETAYGNLKDYEAYWLTGNHSSNVEIIEMIGGGGTIGKYDYVLSKYGYGTGETNLHDFLNRKPSPRSAISSFSLLSLFGEEDNLSTVIIIVASSVALLSVTALSILVIKKRKNKEE